MRNTKSGFTLVELIVVITILAILGTIAFISLGSYTADARNAKRLDGVSKLAEAVNNDQLSGISLLAYVTEDTANNAVAVSVAGTGTTVGIDYQAGDINATALKVNAEQYKDPSQDELYRIGVTTKKGGAFEFAAKLEDGGARTALVKGTFTPRGPDTVTITNLTNDGTNVTGATVPTSAVNFFRAGDTTTLGVISNISSDGTNLSFTPSVAAGTQTTVALSAAESAGLISSGGSFVVDGSTTVLPY